METDIDLVIAQLSNISLEEMLSLAEDGDTDAAKAVLASIGHYLATGRKNISTGESLPFTGEPPPVPVALRDYLATAFYKMANGIKPIIALNITRPGRPNVARRSKRNAAWLVYQGVMQGMPVFTAALTAADHLKALFDAGEYTGLDELMMNHGVKTQTIQTWYYQYKNDLDAIYARSQKKQL